MSINWHPSPRELRRWAFVLASVMAPVGALFYFVDWGFFSGKQGFGIFLWSYALFSLLTAGTGTRVGLPAYWLWMGFVWVIAGIITHVSLAVVYFGVVTPLAFLGRLLGRDRLQLRARGTGSWWHDLGGAPRHDPGRQF